MNLVTIATGRYHIFLPNLVISARKFLPQLNKIFVLSDVKPPDELQVEWLPWGHFQWPLTTLLRYQAFSIYAKNSELFESNLVLYTDVDMLFVGDVKIPQVSGLISVEHPGFVGASPEKLPLEKNPSSIFCISPQMGQKYFAGGIQGGEANSFLKASKFLASAINQELSAGRIPVWHDESAWNYYLSRVKPELILSKNYCTPEKESSETSLILALDKDHNLLRDIHPNKRKLRLFR